MDDQNLSLQKDALHAPGRGRIFEDCVSGARPERPGLADALGFVRGNRKDRREARTPRARAWPKPESGHGSGLLRAPRVPGTRRGQKPV